jgi:O-antigen/teichoic acid export membrane protein
VLLGLGEVAARVASFLATVYLARTLGPSLYGVIVLAGAILLYFNAIAEGGLDTVGVHDLAADPGGRAREASALTGARLILGVALAALLALIGWLALPGLEASMVAMVGLTLLPFALNTRWIHLAQEGARWCAASRMLGELVMAGLVFALVRNVGDLAWAPMAQIAGEAAGALLLAVGLWRVGHQVQVTFDLPVVLRYVRRAWPIVVHSLLGLAIYNSDFLVLRAFHDRAAVGYYGAAYTLVSFLLNLGVAYGQAVLPPLARAKVDHARQLELYHTGVAQILTVGLPIAVGGWLLGGRLLVLIFGPGYLPAGHPLEILIWSIPVAFLRNVPQAALIALERQGDVMRSAAWAAALNLALNFALIPRFGLAGAAWSTLATEVVRTGLALRYLGRAGLAHMPARRLTRQLLATVAMGGVVVLLQSRPPLEAVAAGVLVYGVGLVLQGAVRPRWLQFPELYI